MAGATVRGRFVWHELVTPQSAASHEFYAKALGWQTQDWDGDPTHTMFAGPNGPLGGTVVDASTAPHWVTYVAVDDIDATVEQTQSLGGSVLHPVTEIGGGAGRYAILADPQGVKFGIYSAGAEGTMGPESAPKPGEFSWHELATTDAAAALNFYGKLFGWREVDKLPMGPLGFYHLFGRDGEAIGGVFNRGPEIPCSAWLGYVRVQGLAQVVEQVQAGGGTLVMAPMEVPGGSWIAQFTDPHGARFAVHEIKADRDAVRAAAESNAAASEPVSARAKPKRSSTKGTRSGGGAKVKAGSRAGGMVKAGSKARAAAKTKVKAKPKAKTKAKAKAKVKVAKRPVAKTVRRRKSGPKSKSRAKTRTVARAAGSKRRVLRVARVKPRGKRGAAVKSKKASKKSARRPARRAK